MNIKVLKSLKLLYDVFFDVDKDKTISKMFCYCPETQKSISSTFGTP